METAETHAWLLTLIEGMPQMIWRAVGHGSWTWSSPQWQHYTGQTPQQSQGDGWLVVVHPDDREAGRRAWAQVDQQNIFHVDLRIRGLDGTYRWFQTRALPATGPEGSITEWIGTSTDIDDLRRLQAEQKVLVGELQHRTRNLIAVVHAIALQTVHGSASLDDFQDRFEDRLEALSRVQGLLSHSQHEPITIGTLIELELSALAGSEMQDQITLEGADVTIRETAAQTLALAIHELSTNALKYGALSSSAGKLAIRWYEHGDADDQLLRLEWTESGLPRVAHGAGRVGYGRVLIEQSLPQQLGASTSLTFDDDGVRCVIDLPFRHYGLLRNGS